MLSVCVFVVPSYRRAGLHFGGERSEILFRDGSGARRFRAEAFPEQGPERDHRPVRTRVQARVTKRWVESFQAVLTESRCITAASG